MKKRNKNRIFKKIDKKAALTTQQIVILIILITSFLIIMFFIFRLNLQETTDKDVCHNSVVLRANAALPAETIPLNCKTNYVCITKDNTCEGMPYYSYKINVKNKQEMYEALAEEMADCWWMFGEGKINYVSNKDFTKKLYCSICSQFNFDDSIKDIFPSGFIDKDDFYINYLAKTKIPRKEITYAEYLFGTNDVRSILESAKEADTFGKINISETNALLMGIMSKTSAWKWAGVGVLTAAGAVAGLIFFTPITIGAISGGIILVSGAGTGILTSVIIDGASGNKYLAPTIISFPKDYDKLKCTYVVTKG